MQCSRCKTFLKSEPSLRNHMNTRPAKCIREETRLRELDQTHPPEELSPPDSTRQPSIDPYEFEYIGNVNEQILEAMVLKIQHIDMATHLSPQEKEQHAGNVLFDVPMSELAGMTSFITESRNRRTQDMVDSVTHMSQFLSGADHQKGYVDFCATLGIDDLKAELKFVMGMLFHLNSRIKLKESEPSKYRVFIEDELLKKWYHVNVAVASSFNRV